MTTQRVDGKELTREVSLTRPDGRLDPDAVGWARRPLVDTSGIGRGRGRTKRWEYWNVTTPSHVVALLPDGHERLAVVVPWDERRFQYTVKDVARPAHGSLVLDGERVEVPDARLEPSYVKETRTNLLVLSARTDQAFGQWSGTFADDDVEVAFEGLAGWAEGVHDRW